MLIRRFLLFFLNCLSLINKFDIIDKKRNINNNNYDRRRRFIESNDDADADADSLVLQIVLIVILTLINAFFAMSEMAVISANKTKI